VTDRFVYWMFRLTILVMRPVPLRPAYWFAGHVAVLCYRLGFAKQRTALRANLAQVLQTSDPARIERTARAAFRDFGKYVVDVIHYPSMTREEIRARLRFDEWDDLNRIRESGRGTVIATLHFGNWDLGAAALAAYGYPINAVAERFDYEPMNQLVQGSRERLGMRVVPHDRVGPSVFRLLHGGEMLAMLIDVADDRSAIEVEFFGAPARVSSAPARLALRTGAWLVPAVVLRGPGDDLHIRPLIDATLGGFTPTGDEIADARELTRLTMRALEPHIRAHLDQWFIFTPLWRTAEPRTSDNLPPCAS
jgi:KDO2-lipid IV(A) lauroyltransferase